MSSTRSTDITTDKPPRPRRWIPLSLRLFLSLLLVAGIGSAFWFGVPAYRQWCAIREIDRLGGEILSNPVGPLWFHEMVDWRWLKAFDRVLMVELENTAATDGTLREIACLSELQILKLENTRVTDAGLQHLKGLPNLKLITITGTLVTEAGEKKFQLARPNCFASNIAPFSPPLHGDAAVYDDDREDPTAVLMPNRVSKIESGQSTGEPGTAHAK